MPITRNKQDVTCDNGGCPRAPELRFIYLNGEGRDDDGNPSEPVEASILCRDCAIEEARNVLEVLEGSMPSVLPTLGFMLLPVRMTAEQTRELREEITEVVQTEPE